MAANHFDIKTGAYHPFPPVDDPGRIRVPIHQMTRSEWAKYEWYDDTMISDETRTMVRGLPRRPDDCHKAWEEFLEFALLWRIPPENNLFEP